MASPDPEIMDASAAALIPLGSHAHAADIELKRPVTLIGSRKDIVRLHLQSSTVSKAHCCVVLNGWGCYVHDLGSRTGTFVSGLPVTDADLKDGDVLSVGRFQFRYRAPAKTRVEHFPALPAELAVSTLDGTLRIEKRVLVVGRRLGCDIQFDDSRVSNIHAIIVEQEGRRLIRDLSSRTGTRLDGKLVHQEIFGVGSELKIGPATLALQPYIAKLSPVDEAAAAPAEPFVPETLVSLAAPLTLAETIRPTTPTLDSDLTSPTTELELDDITAEAETTAPEPLDLSTLDFDEPDVDVPTVVTPPTVDGDDLAALRRGWVRPAEPPIDLAPLEPAEPAVEDAIDLAPVAEPRPDEAAPARASDPSAAGRLPPELTVAADEAEPEPGEAAPLDAAPSDLDLAPLEIADLPPLSPLEPAVVAPAEEFDAPAEATSVATPDPEAPAVEAAEVEADETVEAGDDITFAAEPSMPVAPAAIAAAPAEPTDTSLGLDVVADEAAELDLAFEPLDFADDLSMPAAPSAVAEVPTPDEPSLAESAPIEPPLPQAVVATEPVEPVAETAVEAADADLLALDDAEPSEPLGGAVIAEAPTDEAAAEPAVIEAVAPPVIDEPAVAADLLALDGAAVDEELEPLDLDTLLDEALPDVAAETPATPAVDGTAGPSDVTVIAGPPADIDEEVEAPDFELPVLEDEAVSEIPGDESRPAPIVLDESASLSTPLLDEPELQIPAPPAAPSRLVVGDDVPPLLQPDLVRIDDDEDEEEDATALAVDLGLMMDEDVEPAAPPQTPVEIDLATASRAMPPVPTGDVAAGFEELFEADVIESHVDAPPAGPPTAAPGIAAEALQTPDDRPHIEDPHDIPAPAGGTLSDLMPSNGPLLGGSFMPFPMMPLDEPLNEGPASTPFADRPAAEAPGANGANGHAERRRPLRVGFGGNRASPRGGRNGPFASERTIADVLGAPADVGDAFSTPSPAAELPPAAFPDTPATPITEDTPVDVLPEAGFDDLDIGLDHGADNGGDRKGPRGTIRPLGLPVSTLLPPVEAPVAARVTPVSVMPGPTPLDPSARVRLHKKRVRRVITCLVAMVVLIGGAVWAIYQYVPVRASIDALISYEGMDRLGIEDATQFRIHQNEMLVSEPVRQAAVTLLPANLATPDRYGFLASPKQVFDALDQDPKVRWPADQPSVLRLRVRSGDKENDVARLRVLAQAMVNAAEPDRRRRDALQDRVKSDQNSILAQRSKLNDLNDQLQALRQATENQPDPAKLSALNAEYLAAEPVLTNAKSRRQELEATVQRLKQPLAVPALAPADEDPAAADKDLAALNQQLAALQQPAAASNDATLKARQALDDAIAKLQQDSDTAQQKINSPQLAGFIKASADLVKKNRQLTQNYLREQDLNRNNLIELKTSLFDLMQKSAQEKLDADPELKKLNDRLAILTREKNAASASGFDDEAKKGDLELAVIRDARAKRQDELSRDPVSNQMITKVQQLIDQGEQHAREERKNIEETLSSDEETFAASMPKVEQLPAEQKMVTDLLGQKMAAVADARRAYAAAATAAETEAAKNEAAARDQAAQLRSKITARRADVLAAAKARQLQDDEANRQKKLESVQAELATVRQQEEAAAHRVADAAAAIEAADKQRRAYAQGDVEREAKLSARDIVERDLKAAQAKVNTSQAQVAKLIVPDRTPEVHDYPDEDRRPVFAGLAAGGIFLGLLIPLIANLLALAHESHPHPASEVRTVTPNEGFEPLLESDVPPQKALPEPASV